MAQAVSHSAQKRKYQTLEKELKSLQNLVKTYQLKRENHSSYSKQTQQFNNLSFTSIYPANKYKQFPNNPVNPPVHYNSKFLNNKYKCLRSLPSNTQNNFKPNKYKFLDKPVVPLTKPNQNFIKKQCSTLKAAKIIPSTKPNQINNGTTIYKYIKSKNVEEKTTCDVPLNLNPNIEVSIAKNVRPLVNDVQQNESKVKLDAQVNENVNLTDLKDKLLKNNGNFYLNSSETKIDCTKEKQPELKTVKLISLEKKQNENVLSKYKIVNKNVSIVNNYPLNKSKTEALNAFVSRPNLSISKAFTIAKLSKGNNLNNLSKIFLSKKKTPVLKPKRPLQSHFQLVRGNNLTSKFKKLSPKAKLPLFGAKHLVINKYKIENKNKVGLNKLTVRNNSVVCKPKNVLNSTYKIVNPKNTVSRTFSDASVESQNVSATKTVNKCSSLVDNQKQGINPTKQKINKLKHIKAVGTERCNLLTDFTPDELVAMDTESLLQLAALLKSPKAKNKRVSLVKTSKYKLVRKQPSLLNQTANMIKTKYKIRKQKSTCNWKTQFKGTEFHLNHKRGWFKNGFCKNGLNTQSRRPSSVKNNRYKKTNSVIIGNSRYRVSRTKLIRTGRKSMTPKHDLYKTPLRKYDFGKKYSGMSSDVCNVASRVLHRSIQTACASAAKKKQWKKSNNYCMFFNRFGKCNRGTSCPFVHDPSKIAVCTRFLRGTCKDANCPFSHEKSPGKMAVCSYFLQGLCNDTNCPYRHEQLQPNAKLCKQFVQGYCSLGIKCDKAHILICPQYFRGECDKGKACLYPHPPKKEKKNKSSNRQQTDLSAEVHPENTDTELLEKDVNEDDCDELFRYFELKPIEELKNFNLMHRDESSPPDVIYCPPRRDKNFDCPLFIPLDDS